MLNTVFYITGFRMQILVSCKHVRCTVHTVHVCTGRKEEHVLFNDALNTFYLRLYGVGHVVKDHSDSK